MNLATQEIVVYPRPTGQLDLRHSLVYFWAGMAQVWAVVFSQDLDQMEFAVVNHLPLCSLV